MFEDFKDKIRQYDAKDKENTESTSLSPEVIEKLKQRGLDPETVTLAVIPRNLRQRGKRLILNVWCRMGNHDNIRKNPQVLA